MTEKQLNQFFRDACNLEREMRGNELETPFVVLMRICRDYASSTLHWDEAVRLQAQKRLIERLDKFRTKYYEKI